MSKKYDTLVLIGRFQPAHLAHIELLRRAGQLANELIIIVGSADQPRTYKNPFTSEEREGMLWSAVNQAIPLGTVKVHIAHNADTIYNDQAWAGRVQSIVAMLANNPTGKIGLIGHKKDESSFYLNMFPQWALEEVDELLPLNATDIRELYFQSNTNMAFIRGVIPYSIIDFLERFKDTVAFAQIVREREFTAAYKKQFAGLAYPPIFVTVDACLIQSGHVLMIKRRSEPGRGLWAMPGGFLNADSDTSVQSAMIRELREETGIKVPAPVLVGSIARVQVFDAIKRSTRGRTITHCFKILLPDGPLPKVKGSDDATQAKWIPIAEIKSAECFEDHYEIITTMIGN